MKKSLVKLAAFALLCQSQIVSANPFLGEIRFFAGNFAPSGWAFCDGQLLTIASNTALFSLLGTTYGGDGRTTFALPDARGRVLVGAGAGQGLTNRALGNQGGREQTSVDLPSIQTYIRDYGNTQRNGRTNDSSSTNKDLTTVPSSNTQSDVDNMQPFTAVNCIIALTGTYPSRT